MNRDINTDQVPSRPSGIVDILKQEGLLTEDQIRFALRVQAKAETSRTLLEVIERLDFVTQDQIKEALRRRPAEIQLGEILVQLGYIDEKDFRAAESIATRQNNSKKIGDILLEHHLIEEPALLDALSICLGIDYLNLEREQVDPNLVKLAPSKWYETHSLVPVCRQNSSVLIAFSDPLNSEDLRAAQKLFGQNVIKAVARKESISNAVKRALEERKPLKVTAGPENSATQIVDTMLSSALEREASDIHIEPLDDRLRVRFRQDGVLCQFRDYPSELIPPLTNRIKVLCSLDITEKRRHQGGRFFFEHDGAKVDLRVSFYVTVYGEKIVLRLLNRKNQLIKIEDIGISPRMLKRFKEEALYLPTGVLLITGPTGSGKTSTVYSCIQHINNPGLSIITAEEPVEYIIRGVAQCSINPKISLTFEETLRHIVRQDPDVIVIGEIRDKFSAEVAVQAALTGHKVLTTFHTEDTIGGLVRLLNMNIEAFLISSTVISVMAQRLLRKVCPACATGSKVDPSELNHLGYTLKDITNSAFRKGKGCELCQFTGYKWRTGVFELLVLNEAIRDAIIQCRTSQEIRSMSLATAGLVTLLEDGIYKAATGLTTIEEVLRCLPRLQKPRPVEELRRLLGG